MMGEMNETKEEIEVGSQDFQNFAAEEVLRYQARCQANTAWEETLEKKKERDIELRSKSKKTIF